MSKWMPFPFYSAPFLANLFQIKANRWPVCKPPQRVEPFPSEDTPASFGDPPGPLYVPMHSLRSHGRSSIPQKPPPRLPDKTQDAQVMWISDKQWTKFLNINMSRVLHGRYSYWKSIHDLPEIQFNWVTVFLFPAFGNTFPLLSIFSMKIASPRAFHVTIRA